MAGLAKKRLLQVALVAVVALAGSEMLARLGQLQWLQTAYYDLWHNLAGKRFNPRHVILVTVDEVARRRFQDFPLAFWGPHFATAIARLREMGASVIGLDYVLVVSAGSWIRKLGCQSVQTARTYDITLRRQLASGRVVLTALAARDKAGRTRLILPINEFLYSLPNGPLDVGLANLWSDDDGVVRRLRLTAPDQRLRPRIFFATLLALKATGRAKGTGPWRFGGTTLPPDTPPLAIGFAGPPGTFATLPLSSLLAPGAAKKSLAQAVKGKVVIITRGQAGSRDLHLTPYARALWGQGGRLMSGGEVHANIVETLLAGRWPHTAPYYARLALTLFMALGGAVLFMRLSPALGLGALFGLGAAWLAVGYGLFRLNWLIPVAPAQVALLIGYLGVLGLRLTGEEREKARLRSLFGRYVSEQVVEQLAASSRSPDLGGEALEISVLFSDIRNFTTISERLSAHEVVELLNHYLDRACQAIHEHGGTVDKFVGDAIMAVYGAPVRDPRHARQAMHTALELAAIAKEFQTWVADRFGDRQLPPFQIGVGVHSGEAVVGNIGSRWRLEYTAIGDTVNVASRLEGLSKSLQCTIVASQAAIAAAGDGVIKGQKTEAVLKGRREPVVAYQVLGMAGEEEAEAEGYP